MSKNESVEFQIYKSDVLREVQERFGEECNELAQHLFALGEEDFPIGMVMLGFKAAFEADKEDTLRIGQVLTMTKQIDNDLYDLYVAFFLEMIEKKIKKAL